MWAGLLGTRGGGAAVGDWLPPAVKHQLLDGLEGSRGVLQGLLELLQFGQRQDRGSEVKHQLLDDLRTTSEARISTACIVWIKTRGSCLSCAGGEKAGL